MEYSLLAEKDRQPACGAAADRGALDRATEVAVEPVAAEAAAAGDIIAEETHLCGHCNLLGVLGWISLIVNLINIPVTLKLCYDLAVYMHAPHPHDDSYYLAAVAYLFYVPSLVDSVLMVLFITYVLRRVYPRVAALAGATAGGARCACARVWCCVVVCAVLFLVSCWPTGVILTILFQNGELHPATFRMRLVVALGLLWVGVTLSFGVFALALCLRVGVRRPLL